MNDLFSQLPGYDPHPDLWARIKADLDSDDTLTRIIAELPASEPNAALWMTIEDTLAQSSAVLPHGILPADEPVVIRSIGHRSITRQLWATTAAMIVLAGTWLVLRPQPAEVVRMEYAVEQVATPLVADQGREFSTADERAEAFIARQCAEQQLACQRPEVHELRNLLVDLTAEQKRIEQERLTFGDDPVLVRAQVKIENQRAEVTKELITLLRS